MTAIRRGIIEGIRALSRIVNDPSAPESDRAAAAFVLINLQRRIDAALP